MKTMIETKRIQKATIAVVFFTMTMATGYGQGLLMESAAKLFNSFRNVEKTTENITVHANYQPAVKTTGDSFIIGKLVNFSERPQTELEEATTYKEEFSPNVLESFNVSRFELVYENEISTESWMTESFSSELGEMQAVEPWMTESFSNELEEMQAVESWMTESFSSELGEMQAVEPWMTNVLHSELESSVEVEDWMTIPVYSAVDNSLEIEGWMTQPLI